MKKVLTFILVFLSIVVGLAFASSPSVYGYEFHPDEDDYEDLFYSGGEEPTEVTDLTGYTWVGNETIDIGSGGAQVIFDKNIDFISNSNSYNEIKLSRNNTPSGVKGFLLYSEGDSDVVYTDDDNSYSIGWQDNAYKTIIITGGSDVTDSALISWLSANGELMPAGEIEQTPIPWTHYYDYGRVRSYHEDFDDLARMYFDATNSRVYIGFDETTSDALLDFDTRFFDEYNFSDYGALAAWQSPYKNFRVVNAAGTTTIEEWEDVAAVVFESQTNGEPDPRGSSTLTVYYWVDGEIVTDTLDDLDLERAYFYGEVRAAITGEEHMVANVDDIVPLEDFLQYITAWDDLAGDISDEIYIKDDGGYQEDEVGVYEVVFAVEDHEGQESELTVFIHVVDIVAPVISGVTTPVTVSYNQEFNVATWVASLSVSDNYYTGLTISIQSNSYSANKTTLGTYSITVKATDGSGNVGTVSRTINVVDGVGPVFSGLTTIQASIAENLTVQQIKAALSATDAKDGNVTSSITVDSDELTGHANEPGEYTVVFRAQDSAGNQTFHEVTVTIKSAPPGFYLIDGTSVRLLPGASLTVEQILEILGITEGYSMLSTNYQVNIPGIYTLSFNYDGLPYSLNITVLGVDDPILPPPPAVVVASDFAWLWWVGGFALAFVVIAGFIVTKKSKR